VERGIAPGTAPNFVTPQVGGGYGINSWWSSNINFDIADTSNRPVGRNVNFTNLFRLLPNTHMVDPLVQLNVSDSDATTVSSTVVDHHRIYSYGQRRDVSAGGDFILAGAIHDWATEALFSANKNTSTAAPPGFGYSFETQHPPDFTEQGSLGNVLASLDLGIRANGGLGTTEHPGISHSNQYIGPLISWRITELDTLQIATEMGYTRGADRFTVSIYYQHAIHEFGSKVKALWK
jgi:hypothetical protein